MRAQSRLAIHMPRGRPSRNNWLVLRRRRFSGTKPNWWGRTGLLKLKNIWTIRARLQLGTPHARELALFRLTIDS